LRLIPTFFANLTLILKPFIAYGLVLFITHILFLLTIASSVNYKANKIYKLLNQIMVYYSLRRIRVQTRNNLLNVYSRKIKVTINWLLIYFLELYIFIFKFRIFFQYLFKSWCHFSKELVRFIYLFILFIYIIFWKRYESGKNRLNWVVCFYSPKLNAYNYFIGRVEKHWTNILFF
jgi:hypothetical protein